MKRERELAKQKNFKKKKISKDIKRCLYSDFVCTEQFKSQEQVVWDILLENRISDRTSVEFQILPTYLISPIFFNRMGSYSIAMQTRNYYGLWRVLGQQGYYKKFIPKKEEGESICPDDPVVEKLFYYLFQKNQVITLWKMRKTLARVNNPFNRYILKNMVFGLEYLMLDLKIEKNVTPHKAVQMLEL